RPWRQRQARPRLEPTPVRLWLRGGRRKEMQTNLMGSFLLPPGTSPTPQYGQHRVAGRSRVYDPGMAPRMRAGVGSPVAEKAPVRDAIQDRLGFPVGIQLILHDHRLAQLRRLAPQ